MIQKALLIVCTLLALAVVALWGLSGSRAAHIDRLEQAQHSLQAKLDQANGDIEQSAANHLRIVAEKDALLKTAMAQKDAAIAAAATTARLTKEIENAQDSTACRDSSPIGILLDGLLSIQPPLADGATNNRLSAPGRAGAIASEPQGAAGPAKKRHR